MPPERTRARKPVQRCQWLSQREALSRLASFSGKTESSEHIKPIHWYVACRLVLEGGFRPEEVVPRPPFLAEETKRNWTLNFDESAATGSEQTVLGGLKTKDVDVVVNKVGVGPVLAVSCKSALGAYRSLTNRMEETIGECTNIHITYPALVFGYFVALKANREVGIEKHTGKEIGSRDLAFRPDGEPVDGIVRFHDALVGLTGRHGIREVVSKYEAVSLSLIETGKAEAGRISQDYPPTDSPIRIEDFFQTLYQRYDERFVYSAPRLSRITERIFWSESSPLFDSENSEHKNTSSLDYSIRIET